MAIHSGLAPLLPARCSLLILGSFPGAMSLAQGEYYAHPRNAFWPIWGELLGFSPALTYAERVARLHAAGIGLWDLIGCCERATSADEAIVLRSALLNPVAEVIAEHAATLVQVATNGTLATRLFRRLVWPSLPCAIRSRLRHLALPSTSPANARMRFADKLSAWQALLCKPLSGGVE